MPDISGFIKYSKKPSAGTNVFGIQGSWYWYDLESSQLKEVSVQYRKIDSDGNISDTMMSHDWYPPTKFEGNAQKTVVEEICINGEGGAKDGEALALGFELCSPKADEKDLPLELPLVLGQCQYNSGDLQHRFRGVSFDVFDNQMGKDLLIQAQLRNPGEYEKPKKCDIDLNDLTAQNYCTVTSIGKEGNRFHIEVDATQIMPKNNLAMLQVVNLVFMFGNSRESNVCINNVRVLGNLDKNDAHNKGGEYRPVNGACQEFTIERIDDEDIDWVPIHKPAAGGATHIMKKEVSAGQYLEFLRRTSADNEKLDTGKEELDAGGETLDTDDVDFDIDWKSCSVNALIKDSEGYGWATKETSANCISWCDANNFCRWIGGRLPTEKDWNAALTRAYEQGSSWNCNNAVLNDIHEGGVGCGEFPLLPAKGCSKAVKDTSADGGDSDMLCDMVGNLWEWVDDKGYAGGGERAMNDEICMGLGFPKILKGFSFNSVPGFGSDDVFFFTLDDIKDKATCEHGIEPRNPGRIGFRCVKTESPAQ